MSSETKENIQNKLHELPEDLSEVRKMSFAMCSASEALDLLSYYGTSFTREIDNDEASSLCRIISEYLASHAGSF